MRLGPRFDALRTLVIAALLVVPALARADVISDLTTSLLHDSSAKVRIVAAVSLGKLRDRRAVPALEAALADHEATVRGVAASSLAEIGDPSAVPFLHRLDRDPSSFVRSQAVAAVAALAPGRRSAGGTYVAVRSMGNRSKLGGRDLADKLHDFVIRELTHTPDVTLTPGRSRGAYTLEGSITDLHQALDGEYVDVSCTVSLVVGSYPDGAIVMMTSGDATVQTPRQGFSASLAPGMELDALESAVKGANQNLAAFFASRR